MAEAFSKTQIFLSGCSCLSRIAKASPDGPPPTTTTSYSMTSRSIFSCSLIAGPVCSLRWMEGGRKYTAGMLLELDAESAVDFEDPAGEVFIGQDEAHAMR